MVATTGGVWNTEVCSVTVLQKQLRGVSVEKYHQVIWWSGSTIKAMFQVSYKTNSFRAISVIQDAVKKRRLISPACGLQHEGVETCCHDHRDLPPRMPQQVKAIVPRILHQHQKYDKEHVAADERAEHCTRPKSPAS